METMKLINKEIKLVIFDLDGTLIDSTSLWSQIDEKFFNRRGKPLPPTYAKEIAHVGLNVAAKITKDKYFPNEEIEDIIQEWEDLSLEAYTNDLQLKENADKTLELINKEGVFIALATANSKNLYDPCLRRLGIDKYFNYVIDVNSCKNGKDNPEIFDKVCEKFNIKRENTIVFEDSLTAIKTAFNAGFNVVSVYDSNSSKNIDEIRKHSHLFIQNYSEIINVLIKK